MKLSRNVCRLLRYVGKAPEWMFTLLTVALILWLTLAPQPVGEMDIPLFPGADKLVHAVMFGFLNLMVLFDGCRYRMWHTLRPAWIALATAGVALFGIGIEYVQRAMDVGRALEVADMLADTGGSLLAGMAWWLMQRGYGAVCPR